MFSEQGVPAVVFTDQGTQFTSSEFRDFATVYRFQIQHSSPRYPQSNGFIESMVKIVKRTISKAEDSGLDPHLALLVYRTTPLKSGLLSPAEMMTQRKFNALLPVKQHLPVQLSVNRDTMIKQKQQQCNLYDRSAKPLSELQQDQLVRVQLNPQIPVWEPAKVIQTPMDKTPRSYTVETTSGTYQRNRRHLRPATSSNTPDKQDSSLDKTVCDKNVPILDITPNTHINDGIANPARPKRNIRPPERLIEVKD